MTERTNDHAEILSDQEVQDLLVKTSRTFALCIPMLPESLRRDVGIAYLLYRIADTIEDGVEISHSNKIKLLKQYERVLDSARSLGPAWISDRDAVADAFHLQAYRPTRRTDDLMLYKRTACVIASAAALTSPVREVVLAKVRASADGMSGFIESTMRSSGRAAAGIELRSRHELENYCYCVAGIVGEMLTDLFLLDQPRLASEAEYLMARASDFGEALQLVNILKDAHVDDEEGRRFIPRDVSCDAVMEQARDKLCVAQEYVECLRDNDAEIGVVRFTQFPVSLASLTLDRLKREGAGAKVSRSDVLRIVTELAALQSCGSRRPLSVEGQES